MPEQHPQPPGKLGWRWKRTPAAALLLLVGGAIVNIAVAWGVVRELYAMVNPPTTMRQYSPEAIGRMHSVAGWPFHSMTQFEDRGRLSYTANLPLRPLLPGFIINTLFYALLLWLLVATPSAARRMLRRRRGLCEQCAYPIGVCAVCTECGAAVRHPQAASQRLQS